MRLTLRDAFCWFLVLSSFTSVKADEPDDSRIIQQILQAREQILKLEQKGKAWASPVFLAFWDFDGTILKGDCTEGLKNDSQTVYRGLAEVAIENGLSELYPSAGGFERFWTDYTNMDERVGHWLAYPFVAQMLRGAKEEHVLRLSQSYFSGTLSNYLMASSVKIMHELEHHGIHSHIISASPEPFVKGAAESLAISARSIHGIQVRTKSGRLTEELVYPVTWNVGKLERLKQIVVEIQAGPRPRKAYVLAGFGDSYSTDGPFLKFIATQSLPAGKPIAVFYGEDAAPADYKGVFYQANHSATVSNR